MVVSPELSCRVCIPVFVSGDILVCAPASLTDIVDEENPQPGTRMLKLKGAAAVILYLNMLVKG